MAVLSMHLLLTGCGKHDSKSTPAPPVVSVVQPIAREVIEWDEYTGRLNWVNRQDVRARVSGLIESAPFQQLDEAIPD